MGWKCKKMAICAYIFKQNRYLCIVILWQGFFPLLFQSK